MPKELLNYFCQSTVQRRPAVLALFGFALNTLKGMHSCQPTMGNYESVSVGILLSVRKTACDHRVESRTKLAKEAGPVHQPWLS